MWVICCAVITYKFHFSHGIFHIGKVKTNYRGTRHIVIKCPVSSATVLNIGIPKGHMWKVTRWKSHVDGHMWKITCEKSHVKSLMWKVTCGKSHVKSHVWNSTCEIPHVKFHLWKLNRMRNFTWGKITCERHGFWDSHVILELHMWIICETHEHFLDGVAL